MPNIVHNLSEVTLFHNFNPYPVKVYTGKVQRSMKRTVCILQFFRQHKIEIEKRGKKRIILTIL